jgi:cysteine-rich repeat protein
MIRRRVWVASVALGSSLTVVGCGLSSTGEVPGDGGGDETASSHDSSLIDAVGSGEGATGVDGPSVDGAVDAATMNAGTDATVLDTGNVESGVDAVAKDAAAVCGNGILEADEQCDDGNLFDLDGCDSTCKYEVVARMTALMISNAKAPAVCTPATNKLGASVFTATALQELNPDLSTEVTNGTENTLLQFLGLTDLTGTNASGFTVGLLNGSSDPAKGAWPEAGNPIDWWFLADPTSVLQGLPTSSFTQGVITGGNLSAGPSNVSLTLPLFNGAVIDFVSTRLVATIPEAPPPNVPAPPPAALQAGLTVFQDILGGAAGLGICGNITAASLAEAPALQTLAAGGMTACGNCAGSHVYTYCGKGMPVGPTCNSMLDVLVGGCEVDCLASAVNPTQPDVPGVVVVQPLTLGPGNKVTVPAGDNDAYSSFWTFRANRAHFTGQTCYSTQDCQTGKTCNAAGTCE